MTAEVVVMNKLAVALAADSAATVSPKVFNSAEKLFMLIPGRSVGFMVFNFSEFMQLPWETIVKKYRVWFGNKDLKRLQDYAEDFISFLADSKNDLFSDNQKEISFIILVDHYFRIIRNSIILSVSKIIHDKARRITYKEVSDIVSRWITSYFDKWNNYSNRCSEEITKELIVNLRKYKM